MPVTPVEIRHLHLSRGLFGYRKSSVNRSMNEIADSFEAVWRERAELAERVESLEGELDHHLELEQLLRQTLVSAERAAQEIREAARREAEVVMGEANAKVRQMLHDAVTERERLLGDARRIQALLRSALSVVEESPGIGADHPVPMMPTPGEHSAPPLDDTVELRRLVG